MLRLLLMKDAASTQWRPRHLRRRDAITSLSFEETLRFALALALSVPFPRRYLIAATRLEAAVVAAALNLNLRAYNLRTSRAITATVCARANIGCGSVGAVDGDCGGRGVGAGRRPALRRDGGVRGHVADGSREARLMNYARIVRIAPAFSVVRLRVILSTGQ